MKKIFLMTLLAFGAVSVSLGETCENTKYNKCLEDRKCKEMKGMSRPVCMSNCSRIASEECER